MSSSWRDEQRRLNRALKTAYEARDFAGHAALMTQLREHEAAKPKAVVAPPIDWAAVEQRERELKDLARLMSHRTGVNVGAP